MKLRQILLLSCVVLGLSSCQLKRENTDVLWTEETGMTGEVEVTAETEETEALIGKILVADYKSEDLENYDYRELIPELVVGISKEEIEQYRIDPGVDLFETKEWQWSFSKSSVIYYLTKEALGAAYTNDFMQGQLQPKCDYQWRKWITTEEDLDTCSKDEVLALCNRYAEKLGMGDLSQYQIETYALTVDILKQVRYKDDVPDENFIYYTVKEIREAREAGKSEEEINKMYKSNFLINENNGEREWEKKHEAIVVVYYPQLNGVAIAAHNPIRMVYLPSYDEIVCVEGSRPFSVFEVREEVEIISKQEAIDIALLEVGKCTIQNVTYTYRTYDENEFDSLTEKLLIPTWRIDYSIGENRYDSVWINAVEGYKWRN